MADEKTLNILQKGPDAWNNWRSKNPNHTIDLRNVELRAETLSGWNYRGVNLSRADLTGAEIIRLDLSDADFRQAVLQNVYFAKADLSRADFTGADLRGVTIKVTATFESAKFCNADLSGMRFAFSYYSQSPIDFRNADFSGANLSNVDLDYADLSGTKGIHKLSEFLRAIVDNIASIFNPKSGALDNSVTPSNVQFHSCFISYSHSDKTFANKLFTTLTKKGISCWLDEHQVLPGDDIYDEIERGIKIYEKILLCCSKAALTSWWVDNEITIAFEKEQALWKQHGKKSLVVIPLNLDGFLFSGELGSGKASQIKSRLAADFVGWETDEGKFMSTVTKLCKALQVTSA